jgi:hypothetical protein
MATIEPSMLPPIPNLDRPRPKPRRSETSSESEPRRPRQVRGWLGANGAALAVTVLLAVCWLAALELLAGSWRMP